MRNILKKIFAPRTNYQPLIEIRIFQDAILHNLKEYQNKYPNLRFAPVLKSNAYGHGLINIGKILDNQNLPFFMVDSFFEALQLRRENIKTKILILGYNRLNETIGGKLKNVSFGVIDFEQLKQIIAALKKPQTFHLKIDTGMHRQGILVEQVDEAIKLIKSNSNFILEGVCSHFATADDGDQSFVKQQIEIWNKITGKFKNEFPSSRRHSEAERGKAAAAEESQSAKEILHASDALGAQDDATSIKYFHVSNTAGTFYTSGLDVNVGRLGIGLYGINQSPFEKLNLQPALEMVSIISSIKKIKSGEKVGYGITFTAPKDMVVATVPVGYNEGVDRRLSNIGFFKVADVDCPLVGRVSMNMSSIDVTGVIPEALSASEKLSGIQSQAKVLDPQADRMHLAGMTQIKLEQEVQIISPNSTDKNSVENIAKLCNCLPYEVLVKIPSYLKRVIY
jgi:alanine racemase